jgi:uncharacterized protein YbjT (DUF2867 family)
MPEPVLVTGATGTQGGAVARGLLAAGYPVQALVRNPSSDRALALVDAGATLVKGDLLDVDSLTSAFSQVGVVYAITTPFDSGTGEEERQGATIIAGAEASGLGWLVLASVASADRTDAVPHFASKRHIELQLAATTVPWTVIAPSYFYENVLGSMDAIRQGALPMAIPPDKPLAQVALTNLGQLVATVIGRRRQLLHTRVEVAGDAPTPAEMAAAFGARYENVPLDQIASPDMQAMYTFLSEQGYAVDPVAVRARYPEVPWVGFADWAAALKP